MSEEGKTRWKEAIDKKLEFKPFKNLEPLYPYLTDSQKQRLLRALSKQPESITAPAQKIA